MLLTKDFCLFHGPFLYISKINTVKQNKRDSTVILSMPSHPHHARNGEPILAIKCAPIWLSKGYSACVNEFISGQGMQMEHFKSTSVVPLVWVITKSSAVTQRRPIKELEISLGHSWEIISCNHNICQLDRSNRVVFLDGCSKVSAEVFQKSDIPTLVCRFHGRNTSPAKIDDNMNGRAYCAAVGPPYDAESITPLCVY